MPITVAVLGAPAGSVPRRSWRRPASARCSSVEHPALEPYTPDGYVMALQRGRSRPRRRSVVLLPHTYQTRDFAPMLAARLRTPLITDVTGINGHRRATPRSRGRCSRASSPRR